MNLKPSDSCEFDLISLGEVMLRLDPGNQRVRNARRFDAWEGGGEYNVARGLHKCFGLRTAILTAFADNEVGRLIEDLISQGGVDMRHVLWKDFDGIGRSIRNGLNFTERGFGVRGAVGVSDRGLTASSQLLPEDFDWQRIFQKEGSRWFHTGGIFAALSEKSALVVKTAINQAKSHGTRVSYDLNYRPSLWKSIGGKEKAQEVNREICQEVDVLIGNEEDFQVALGLEVKNLDSNYSNLEMANYQAMVLETSKQFPNLELIAVTLRTVHSASINDWTAIAWSKSEGFAEGRLYKSLEIFDRVGGGDSFASGLIFGILQGSNLTESIEIGLAHGALAMTTPGDTSMATYTEVKKLVQGGNARVER